MGNRILIWRSADKGTGLDIFEQTNYSTIYKDVTSSCVNICPNWGNKLWFQGLISEIDDGENQITFRSNESVDEINNNFDLIIYPMANFFGIEYCSDTSHLVSVFSQIKIPTYIIACGVQARNYDELDFIIKKIGEPAKKFISSIYETGGEIALRGEFSKEFFDRLGFSSAVVTGCPSLYQLGQNFKMDKIKVDRKDFLPVFNGKMQFFTKAIKYYKESVFIDQDFYFLALFDPNFLNGKGGLSFKYNFYKLFGTVSAELLSENRIKMIADMNDWYHYLKNGPFNYAFGSRIHGCIMSILAGVPATLLAIDSRTKEMAEFFDIPHINVSNSDRFNGDDVYESYLEADYTKFNNTFKDKYLKYQSFLKEHKIISEINQNNRFFKSEDAKTDFDKFYVNSEEFEKFSKELKKLEPLLKCRSFLSSIKNR